MQPAGASRHAIRRDMTLAMPARPLQLTLRADDHVPADISWRIDDGYIRANTWNEEGESITLGIWGPGDLITPIGCDVTPYELISLTRVVVVEFEPSEGETLDFMRDLFTQTTQLLQIHRVRPADSRLLRLLHWIGARFGRVSTSGTTLSLEDMNLTHRQLADIAGMTRVTVTKSLTRFRSKGQVVKVSEADLLVPRAASPQIPSENPDTLPVAPFPFPKTLRHEPPAHRNAGFDTP
ncbi:MULTISPECIES: Crp/Fnr family transcriptional regulator [unclassified Synechococcus]|uniref:Crp/Fnr family transcriptional regulator n=1 Tax=unclassified Synechococcus TaxID=2626047 RepID=UPI0013030A7D|nr:MULTISPECIES: Crp/Fnr family transcriptional regulator [unclassified Synechococcus]MBD2717981.1 Crp/Fnr family transcriptional regulator [Synechococcus sp. FACHB-909]